MRQKGLVPFFASPDQNLPFRDAIEFYRHQKGWSNRLVAGDSLLVMNSLLEKEGFQGKVQMIYIDPPYGIKYGSNFQPFVNKRGVKDGKDDDLTQEPEMIKAFRDTWELGIHSYLTYLRDRLLLARELLSYTGSIFIQINDMNINYVKNLLDEIFGRENFINVISFRKTGSQTSKFLSATHDFLIWYAKDKTKTKFNRIFIKDGGWVSRASGLRIRLPDGSILPLNDRNKKLYGKIFANRSLQSQTPSKSTIYEVEFNEKIYSPKRGWSTNIIGMQNLIKAKRIIPLKNTLRYIVYADDFPYSYITALWNDVGGAKDIIFAVQTNTKVIERCILMTTKPGDIVFDPTCGSGTTAFVAEKWGRRWITCDTSRVAITLAKQRLLTSLFDYYQLKYPDEGIGSGFNYLLVPRITLRSIANEEPPDLVTIYDQPNIDKSIVRVTGPFTVEAVPAPFVKPITEFDSKITEADDSVVRDGETLRQSQWRAELLKTGIRGRSGQKIDFTRIEAIPGTQWLHADSETKEDSPKRAVISFGPEYAPLEQRQVELAINEAQKLVPNPKLIIFASFQFDPEASKDIDETNWPGVTLLKAQMNADLLTEDLKKKRASNESFWLIGQPDVKLTELKEGKYQVRVWGFDYYNTITGEVESGGPEKIAMWMLDTDYDYRSLFPRQVFFPMENDKIDWSRLARNLKSEIDEELIEQYRGTTSIPFTPGDNKAIAVKIIDDRGIESLKIIKVK